jgi:hypothetical protein
MKVVLGVNVLDHGDINRGSRACSVDVCHCVLLIVVYGKGYLLWLYFGDDQTLASAAGGAACGSESCRS